MSLPRYYLNDLTPIKSPSTSIKVNKSKLVFLFWSSRHKIEPNILLKDSATLFEMRGWKKLMVSNLFTLFKQVTFLPGNCAGKFQLVVPTLILVRKLHVCILRNLNSLLNTCKNLCRNTVLAIQDNFFAKKVLYMISKLKIEVQCYSYFCTPQ